MGALGFATAIGYGPYMVDGATALRWAILAIALPLLWQKPRLTVGHVLYAAWLVWAAVSAAWTPDRWSAMQHLIYLAMGGLAFCLGGEAASLRGFARGAALGLSISSALAVAQVFGYAGIWQGVAPAGLFYNKNMMAEALALCAILCLMYKDWPYALALAPGLILAHCRSADCALAIAGIIALWQSKHRATSVALALCALFVAHTFDTQTLDFRLTIWLATLSHLAVFGHGLGSFYSQYPDFGPLIQGARPEYPHNELIYAAYELGLGAIAPCALALWCWLGEAKMRPFLAAGACISFFSFPLQLPFTLLVLCLGAGHCAYSRRSLRYIAIKWRGTLYGRAARASA